LVGEPKADREQLADRVEQEAELHLAHQALRALGERREARREVRRAGGISGGEIAHVALRGAAERFGPLEGLRSVGARGGGMRRVESARDVAENRGPAGDLAEPLPGERGRL